MKTASWIRCVSALGFLCGCDAEAASKDQLQVEAAEQAIEQREHGQHSCGDHEDDGALDTAELRERAARPVSWRSGKGKKSPTVRAKILGFNDFHGQLSEGRRVANRPVGGAAVLASYLRAAQVGFEGKTLIVHAGDHVGASPPESALLQDEPSIQFLNALANSECEGPTKGDKECNVVGTLGNHEFDEGKDEFLRLLNGGNHPNGPFLQSPYVGARFPYVSSNVVVLGKKPKFLVHPFLIRKIDGVRLGVIGAVLKETPSIVTPAGVAGLSFLDEVDAINAQVAVLKGKGVRAIVVTIHQGAFQTGSNPDQTSPAATVGAPIAGIVSRLDDEVDVVVSGHSHSFTNAFVQTPSGHPILVTQAFSASTAYSDIDLELDRASGDVLTKTARVVTTFSDVAPGNVRDPKVQAIVDQARELVAPFVNRQVARFSADVTNVQNAAGESSLGNLIADSQRAAAGTDFAFMNPGGIRTSLVYAQTVGNSADADGLALWGELFAIQPFGNDVVTLRMTGQQIYDLLNQQFAVNRFLQISGLTYTWDNSRPASDRVSEVRKDGAPIDRAATYSVAANNFIAGGGDNFTVFLSATDRVVGPVDIDALVAYLPTLPQPFAPPALGRITRLN